MFIYILSTSWMFTILFMFMNHPLSLGCILLIQTILISLASGFFYLNFWFSYILFLIMIGGMLVMFIYMTSIASNEKFKMPKKILLFCSIYCMLLIIILLNLDKFFSNFMNLSIDSTQLLYLSMNNISLSKFFNFPGMFIMIFLMIYLLITLIAIVKIVGKSSGTLRQK
uniref:NADH-ubiquinone oxidoreductase chain 6 n=1 Tax=Eucryptorrhynchus scrobiculatus TaxID=1552824 RepID=A0A0D5W413_EUCSC|nr:NADH dehydrogenase subunit 6 [Eucryptorrhynchus scrobiculatus]AJR19212.1 NADH dehydrogenase subunit 6 [Eucryptorrhynchus scrobiculatus]AJZ71912.1 NADH dehydrogenase subunit 6 [Eucryptorrhynchus scrobiculatus]UNO31868.1 NADH dehydrogenase subunit 6 [Eucryptorrhynchus scrobiculatus]